MSEQPDDLERLDGVADVEGELAAGPDIVEEFWEGDDRAGQDGSANSGAGAVDDDEIVDAEIVDDGNS